MTQARGHLAVLDGRLFAEYLKVVGIEYFQTLERCDLERVHDKA